MQWICNDPMWQAIFFEEILKLEEEENSENESKDVENTKNI